MFKNPKSIFKLITGSFFLVIYHVLLVSPMLEFVHFEHEHENIHTAENELDPCHQAIYHGGIDLEHEGEGHITSTEDSCIICLYTFSTHVPETEFAECSIIDDYLKQISVLEIKTHFRFVSGVQNKAPPVV